MSNINLDISINPILDQAELKRIIKSIQTDLGLISKVKIDDKGLSDPIKKAADEAEKLAEETNKVPEAFKKIGDEAQKTAGGFAGIKDSLKGAFDFSSIANFTAAGLVTSGIGLITENFVSAINAGNEFNSALLDIQAKTGATAEEMKLLEKASIQAFEGGVGESVAEAAKIIGEVQNRLGNVFSANELTEFTKKANALGIAYDLDVNEVIKKSEPFIKQFGLSAEESFNLIALAQKEGGTASDDILDSLSEYSQLASKAGFSAQEFTGLLVSGAKEGIFNTDKLADSIKEAEIRIKAGDFTNAFKGINESASAEEKALIKPIEAIVNAGKAGKLSIKETLQQSTKLIDEAFKGGKISESLASQLQVAIAGTPAEDIGTELFGKIFSAPINETEIDNKAKKIGDNLSNAVGQYTTFDTTTKKITSAVTQISQVLVKSFDSVIKFVGEILNSTTFTFYIEIFNSIRSAINPLISEVSSLFNELSNLFKSSGDGIGIMEILQSTFKFLGQVVGVLISTALTPMITTVRLFVGAFRIGVDIIQNIVRYFKDLANSGGNVSSVLKFVQESFVGITEWVLKAGKSIFGFLETLGLVSSKVNSTKIEPKFDDNKLNEFRDKVKQLKEDSVKLTQDEIKLRQDAIANEINQSVKSKTIQSNNAETLKKALFEIRKEEIANGEVVKKTIEDKRTIYQIAKESFELLNKENLRLIENTKLELEITRAKENKNLTIEDEILLNNLLASEQQRQLVNANKLLEVKKKDNKETEDAKNIVEELKKSILSTNLNSIKLNAKLELENTEILKIQEQINRKTLETEVKLKLKSESVLLEDDIKNINKTILELETELNNAKVGINTKAQAEINLKLTNAQSELALKRLELEDKYETERLNKIIDNDLKTKEVSISNLNKSFKEQLLLIGNNDELRLKAELDFQLKKSKIEDDYLESQKDKNQKLLENSISSFSDFLQSSTLNDFGNVEAEKQAKATIENIKNEEEELKKSFRRRQISKEDYYSKLADLDDKRLDAEKEVAKNSFNIWNGINNALIKSIKQSQELILKSLQIGINAFKDNGSLQVKTTKEIENLKAQITKDAILGNTENIENSTKILEGLEKRKVSIIQDSELLITEAYYNTAAAIGITTAQMVLSGQSATKSLVSSSLAGLKALVPIFVVKILGEELSKLSFGGLVTAALLSGVLYTALSAAEAGASKLNFRKGGAFESIKDARANGGGLLNGKNKFEIVNYNEEGSEFFVNHIATMKNKRHLTEINSKNLRIEDYAVNIPEVRSKVLSSMNMPKYFMTINNSSTNLDMSKLTQEIKELKEVVRVNHRKINVTSDVNMNVKFDDSKFLKEAEIRQRRNIRR